MAKQVHIRLPYDERLAFAPLHRRKQRWACLVAHRRAGKTVAVVNDIIIKALLTSPPAPYAYFAPFRSQAKSVAWEYFKKYSEPVKGKDPNEAELKISLVNGAVIKLFGSDNADAARGEGFQGLACDEYGDFRPSVWGNVLRPTLSDRKGWAIFMGTPKGHNQFYDVHRAAQAGVDESGEQWLSLILKASQSGILDASELRAARAQLSEDQYLQEYECFPPDAPVICHDTVKPISEVKPGDVVLTHTGRFRRVTTTMSKPYIGELVEIDSYGGEPLRCTPEHPIRVCDPSAQTYSWKPATEIAAGDWVVTPRMETGHPVIGGALAEVIAWFVAEGCVSGNVISFAIGAHEPQYVERLQFALTQLGVSSKVRLDGGVADVSVNDVILCDFLVGACGSGAHYKRLPLALIRGNEHLVWDVLMMGDGCIHQPKGRGHARPVYTYSTVSETLAQQVQILGAALGFTGAYSVREEQVSQISGGRTIRGGVSYSVQMRSASQVDRNSGKTCSAKNGALGRVRAVRRVSYSGHVHNLSVVGDESYVVYGRAVHNCSFDAAILGAYYGREMTRVDAEGRLRTVEHDPAYEVNTAWDIGRTDDTSIWFYQNVGTDVRLLDHHAEGGGSIEEFTGDQFVPGSITNEVIQRARERDYRYGRHWLPHDARAKTLASDGKSVVEKLAKYLGQSSLAIAPMLSIEDGIQAVRTLLPRCVFDPKCNKDSTDGVEALRQYQREYDEDKKAFRKTPLHSWASHPSDAFRMLAVAERRAIIEAPRNKRPLLEEFSTVGNTTLDDLWARKEEQEAQGVRI